MSKDALSLKKLELLCFGLTPDKKAIDSLLNNFAFDDIYISYFSKMDYRNPEDYALIEKFVTGISNCNAAFGKNLDNIALSIMLQPYYYVDFSNEKELKTIKGLVDFYVSTGEKIYDIVKKSDGIVKLDV